MRTHHAARPGVAARPRGVGRLRVLAALASLVTLTLLPPAAPAAEPPSPCLLAPVRAPVADPFRPPVCTWCAGNRGIEYATAPGTAVRAGAAGSVSFAGSVAGTRYVVVEHASGLRSTYGRLAGIAVSVGTGVAAGTVVGVSGSRTFFGVRRGERYLDPAQYLLATHRRPRLVPTGGGPRRPDRSARYTCPARERLVTGSIVSPRRAAGSIPRRPRRPPWSTPHALHPSAVTGARFAG